METDITAEKGTSERYIGTLEGVSGHTYDIVYDLVFTTKRVIAYIIYYPTDIPSPSFWQYFFLGNLGSKISDSSTRSKFTQKRRDALKTLALDELATSHTMNFEIHYDGVIAVAVVEHIFRPQLRFHLKPRSGKARIINFTLTQKQISQAQHLLRLALPEKIALK